MDEVHGRDRGSSKLREARTAALGAVDGPVVELDGVACGAHTAPDHDRDGLVESTSDGYATTAPARNLDRKLHDFRFDFASGDPHSRDRHRQMEAPRTALPGLT